MQGWRRGVVVSGVRRMNEVNARRARLLPGWVTIFGRVYHLVWSCLQSDWLPSAAAELFRSPLPTPGTLPEHIVSDSTLQSFKRHLKTFLLQQSFRLALQWTSQ